MMEYNRFSLNLQHFSEINNIKAKQNRLISVSYESSGEIL